MPFSLSKEEATRYHRQLVLPDVGASGQQQLKQATIMIAGLWRTGFHIGLLHGGRWGRTFENR